ncbi:hypothetical protein Sjap_006385 [Stephania japonica]|uniref:CRM domain-containing protein n=1 Tax=Stephania japonica TaxID=461633 RepID=A0AAP0PJP4_9MAGN
MSLALSPSFHSTNCNSYKTQNSFRSSEKYPPRNSRFVLGFKCIRRNHSVGRPYRPKLIKAGQGSMGFDVTGDGELLSECNGGDGSRTVGGKMGKIMEKLKGFGYAKETNEAKERLPAKKSLEHVFYAEEGNSKGGFSRESELVVGKSFGSNVEGLGKVEEPLGMEKEGRDSGRWRRRSSLAELTLPDLELRRLRNLSVRVEESIDIGVLGVNQAIVDMIHEKWKTSEVVRLNCHAAHAPNMKRMHEMLEVTVLSSLSNNAVSHADQKKTGGLVIWNHESSMSVYRGASYELPSVQALGKLVQLSNADHDMVATDENNNDPLESLSAEGAEELESLPDIDYEHEVDQLLNGLGPRYYYWPGGNPLPVDADLLPGSVSGYKPPFRLLPYRVRSTLGIKEVTALRRLAKILPPHFAIGLDSLSSYTYLLILSYWIVIQKFTNPGRSRRYEGLAMAMAKLWERSSIAKIALKRGVQLTAIDRMAEDIKNITGGTILSINKDCMAFFRGKDFLPEEVAEALFEREILSMALQDEEEQARVRASSLVTPIIEINEEVGETGTLGETQEADARWGKKMDDNRRCKVLRAGEVVKHIGFVRKLEQKLAIAECKLMRAERSLAKVEAFLKPTERLKKLESITDEERFLFRKIGLRMNAFLLIGRRGVFDGTVESMHMHWKYRELVKIVVKAKSLEQVRNIAVSLEAESGGILVSVDKISEGFAIIIYRGKEYKQPSVMRPKNLLSKRKALARSLVLQRREALYKHVSDLERTVDSLRSELDQTEEVSPGI